jgi:transcriptional regulator
MTKLNLLQGTLDLLVMKVIQSQPMHGYAIARTIQELSQESLRVEEGSLYPSLYRMEKKGWIRSAWRTTDRNRRARFYELTAEGRKQLAEEEENWEKLSGVVDRIMRLA